MDTNLLNTIIQIQAALEAASPDSSIAKWMPVINAVAVFLLSLAGLWISKTVTKVKDVAEESMAVAKTTGIEVKKVHDAVNSSAQAALEKVEEEAAKKEELVKKVAALEVEVRGKPQKIEATLVGMGTPASAPASALDASPPEEFSAKQLAQIRALIGEVKP